MGRHKTDRTGEKFITSEGYKIIIIKYYNSDKLLVEFQDKYRAIIHTSYQACRKGSVKNPYHPSVFGVGMIGLMPDGSKPKTSIATGTHTREYYLWKRMLGRCYYSKCHENNPTYKDVTVCDRWLVFANFVEDLPLIEGYELWLNHPNERICLDKDIKGNGSKVYCLENCCFVTNSDNVKERIERCGNGEVKVYGINIKTGERTKDFNSYTEASKELGINNNISQCINGRQKTCGGYKWFKVES